MRVSTSALLLTTSIALLLQCNKLQAYIHPILPVLDVTRPIVSTFNVRYQRAIVDVKSKFKRIVAMLDAMFKLTISAV